MQPYQILFDSLEWQSPAPGVRYKIHREGSKHLRLVEFTSEFVEPDWCEKGHIGLVLEGELEVDFKGRVVRFPPNSGIIIPPGPEHGHKARSVTPTVLVFLVEDL